MSEEKDWKVLNDFQHARHRNEMYFGSRDPHTQVVLDYTSGKPEAVETTWIPAVFTAFREVLDNALDEVVTHGHGNRVDVTYDPERMEFSITDNGRGIPINFDEEQQQYAATVLLSHTKAGRNFGDRGNSRGMNGIGASVVNYCSEYFTIDINRDKTNFVQRFRESETDLVIEDPNIVPLKQKKGDKRAETGTRVTFKLSSSVYPRMDLPESFIRSRVFEVALCYPQLAVTYNGKPVTTKGSVEKTLFAGSKPIAFTVREANFISQFWLVPEFQKDGSEISYGLVNAIPTFQGGSHIDAFKRFFFSGLLGALETTSKKRRLTPNRSDIADGLLVYNITEMDAPSFDSQNKTRLINEECTNIIKRALDDPDFFKKVIRTNPEWIDSIYARCAERTRKKDDAELAREAKKNKRLKVEDLEDACGADRSKCILFLGEGRSAISGMVEARDAEVHGGLPLRGKVLNVHGVSGVEIMKNEALAKIMAAVGLVPFQRTSRSSLRYGTVRITCDSDEDGKNIQALLVNFFYRCWPWLFYNEHPTETEINAITGAIQPKRTPVEEPFIYVFDTPLIIAVKGKQRKYWYADNVHEFLPDDYKGWEITRAKGLAALKKEDWKASLANPKIRPIVGDLDNCLDLLFNPARANDRKEWIGR
jgi:DNA gyrase/topoisomerase IV subunit B